MTIHIDNVHITSPACFDRALAGMYQKLDQITEEQKRMSTALSAALAQLQQEVAASRTVEDSAITLLTGLKAKLDEAIASNDPAAILAFSASLAEGKAALAASIAVNTPAATPAGPDDPPAPGLPA